MRYHFDKTGELPHEWIALDTETGGLDATKHALLSIAVWSPTYQDSWLTRPFGVTEPDALKINGLDPAKCASDGLKQGESADRLMIAIRDRAIVGQNIGFDLGFIARRVFGLMPGDEAVKLFRWWKIVDIHDIFKRRHPDEPCHLHEIASYYGIVIPGRYHDALYDAEVTGRVYMAMLEEQDG